MLADIESDAKEQMGKAIDALRKQLATVRAGRASAGMLDNIKVEYYGAATPLNQVASVQVPDARMLIVKPFDKTAIRDIEKAIMEANLGLQPQNDGDLIRLPIPALSEERRKEYVKQARSKGEDAKIAVRNARRDANDMLKAAKSDGDISEDDEKRGLKMVQDHTDTHVKMVDDLLDKKESEILQV
jgi:ribosome recycling factor